MLIKATEILTDSLQGLSQVTRLGKFTVTALLMALATSLPELVVGVTAALGGKSSLALGTVIGSNIADISLVIGGAAILGGSFSVVGEWLKIDVMSVFLAGSMPLMLMLDKNLSRADGVILLLVYGLYNLNLLKQRRNLPVGRRGRLLRRMFEEAKSKQLVQLLAWLAIGAAMLILSAQMIIKLGVITAQMAGLPEFLVGLFLLAIGTSLPELSFEIEAVRKKQAGMVLGDLFGSVVVNSTLILGIVSLIAPIKLEAGLNAYLLAAMAFGGLFCLFWVLVRSKKKLERWEGALLVVAYLVFAFMEWKK